MNYRACVAKETFSRLDHYFFNLDFHHSVAFFWLFAGLAASATRLALTNNQLPITGEQRND